MNDNQPWTFTCKTCGSHNLTVTRVWKILAGPDSETWQEWGPLEADHHWIFKFKEKIEKEKDNDDEVEPWDFAEYTKDDSSSKPEEYEIYESEDDPGSDEFYVNCAGCDQEIEFGWSQANRGGGIFPVECSDFIPGKYWPELRYLDSWQQKGWLQKELKMDSANFPIEFNNEIDDVKKSENKHYTLAVDRLSKLAEGHNDISGAMVNFKLPAKEHQTAYIYEITIVLYMGSNHIAATEKGEHFESTLDGALDAVEYQVRERRKQQRNY